MVQRMAAEAQNILVVGVVVRVAVGGDEDVFLRDGSVVVVSLGMSSAWMVVSTGHPRGCACGC